jgi:RNA polymerase sigma factor for flagellar operon FliA
LNRHINRESLLVELLPLAERMALKIRGHLPAHVELDDLIANGVLGLVDALAKFDPSKGVKFATYAVPRVRGAILDGLRNADPVSRHFRRKTKRIHTLYRELENRLGRPVQDEEIAEALGMNLGHWHHLLNEFHRVGFDCGSRVLSAAPTITPQPTDPEFLVNGSSSPFDLCYRREQRRILAQAFSTLPDREREVITFYHQHGLTMKQIATRMKVDESRISQIHSTALVRLRATVNSLLEPTHVEAPTHGLSMAAGAN